MFAEPAPEAIFAESSDPADALFSKTTTESDSVALPVAPVSETVQESVEAQDLRARMVIRLQREQVLLFSHRSRVMPALEAAYQQLSQSFAPLLWEKYQKAQERAEYKAQESEWLLKLANRLLHEPLAPSHRVLLNLQRSNDKWSEISHLQTGLETCLEKLVKEKDRAQQDCEQLQAMLGLPEWAEYRETSEFQKAERMLAAAISQLQTDRPLDLKPVLNELAWVARVMNSWKNTSNPEEESMVAL
ncbi:hypothetical protein COW20_04640 [bacterium (Candidatus Blackallbacteria) CG13_big_fil_rev_8_21_14_2_50_49_14]|nr:MAG: hypothetical protein COW64_00010 [bacterium (Candidatus Blackallbacteria) CG18_big_fil_WC_8_21_14_2_50_49_26]PIW49692.1 MAG: hypothetical protein COW20_04640 [bacterium (Candidatus Blackallbacteria) CG13_big_fil_rev_8_21_14_2_50_49_14]